MRGIVPATVLITLSVLFLLGEFTHVGFGRTWPIFLIALGVAIAIQRSVRPASADACCSPDTTVAPPAKDAQEVKHG